MRLRDLSQAQLQQRLAGNGIWLQTGPFTSRIQSRLPTVTAGLALLYPDYPLADDDDFADFHVRIYVPSLVRRWWRPQVQFAMDGRIPFKPLPISQAYPLLEWGLNWCITSHAHRYLLIHAAVIERNGRAVIMPGTPGSGKSTLAAALIMQGWRLLSDEMAVIDMDTLELIPVARPVSLKNASIDVIQQAFPSVIISPPAHDTLKGTVAHMRVPASSILQFDEHVPAGAVVFPRYHAEARPAEIMPETPGRTLLRIADNTFNYSLLGQQAFTALTRIVGDSRCYDLRYADMNEASAWFEQLANGFIHG